MEIQRGDLARLLYEPARDHADYRFGDHVTAVAEDEAAVAVTFASGPDKQPALPRYTLGSA